MKLRDIIHDPLDREHIKVTKQSREDALNLSLCYLRNDVEGARILMDTLHACEIEDLLRVWMQLDSKVRTWIKRYADSR